MSTSAPRHALFRSTRLGLVVFICCYAGLVLAYYGYLNDTIKNFPRQDDFRAILIPIISWQENRSLSNLLTILFSQHNEHKILTVRLLSLLFYETEGVINFKHLTLAGNIFLSAFPLAFLIDRKLPHYFYIAILPLFFSATPYLSSHWATTALSNFPVVLFATLAAYLSFYQQRNLHWLAMTFACLSTFSQGNGIAIFFLLTLHALINWKPSLKLAYTAGFLTAAAFYFYDWHTSPTNPSISIAIKNPLLVAQYVFCLMGSLAQKQNSAFILGIFFLTTYLIIRRPNPTIKPGDLIVLFIFFSAAMAASNRLIFGLSSAIESRYTIYSLLFSAVIFCELGSLIKSEKTLPILCLALFSISAAYAVYSWTATKQSREDLLENIQSLRQRADGSFSHVPDRAKHVEDSINVLIRCRELGIYTPPLE